MILLKFYLKDLGFLLKSATLTINPFRKFTSIPYKLSLFKYAGINQCEQLPLKCEAGFLWE